MDENLHSIIKENLERIARKDKSERGESGKAVKYDPVASEFKHLEWELRQKKVSRNNMGIIVNTLLEHRVSKEEIGRHITMAIDGALAQGEKDRAFSIINSVEYHSLPLTPDPVKMGDAMVTINDWIYAKDFKKMGINIKVNQNLLADAVTKVSPDYMFYAARYADSFPPEGPAALIEGLTRRFVHENGSPKFLNQTIGALDKAGYAHYGAAPLNAAIAQVTAKGDDAATLQEWKELLGV